MIYVGYGSLSAQTILGALRDRTAELASSSSPGGGPYSIHFRTLGDIAYFMTSLNTPSELIRSVEDRIWNVLEGQTRGN